jgi:hypothetical protein
VNPGRTSDGTYDCDPKALSKLFEDWKTETMHAHGWARAPWPEAPPAPCCTRTRMTQARARSLERGRTSYRTAASLGWA